MFGELVKPIDTLINRSCDGIGGFLKPWQMKRIAKTEIEIEQLKAQNELAGNGVLIDTQRLIINAEIQKQANLHNIKIEALDKLDKTDSLQDASEDFINYFLDKAQNVSDEYLQQLWGKVLAGELKSNGSFSKRTLHFISTLNVEEANLINSLFEGLAIFDGKKELFIGNSGISFPYGSKYAKRSKMLTQNKFDHLESLGLFTTSKKSEIWFTDPEEKDEFILKNMFISLDEKIAVDIIYSKPLGNSSSEHFVITKTPLTKLGREIAAIAQPSENRKKFKYMLKRLAENNTSYIFKPHRYYSEK